MTFSVGVTHTQDFLRGYYAKFLFLKGYMYNTKSEFSCVINRDQKWDTDDFFLIRVPQNPIFLKRSFQRGEKNL